MEAQPVPARLRRGRIMNRALDAALAPLESTDPFLLSALSEMAALMAGTEAAAALADVQLYLVDYRHAPRTVLRGDFFTPNCAALRNADAIIVNEGYLLEIEAAVRSFALAGELLATPYLRSDEDLFGLVGRVRADPRAYVKRLRALDRLPGPPAADVHGVESVAMLAMFLMGHELGHLRQGHEQRAFGAFVDPAAPPEHRVGNAVVKLARHAREFARLGFGLPGFEKAIDESSEVGANEKRWRNSLPELQINHQRWFDDEADADDHAATLVQQVLDRVAASDAQRADRLLVDVVNALFAAALVQWQSDLGSFLQKVGLDHLSNTQQLSITMMQDRTNYIHAAELFGDVHRFTLLRAILAVNGWLHARGVLSSPLEKPLRRIERAHKRAPLDDGLASQCRQREVLMRIHADTAIKIANVGSATGWMLEKDKKRGTQQLFMMQFESIAQSADRLRALM
jgi:hypothetical protein